MHQNEGCQKEERLSFCSVILSSAKDLPFVFVNERCFTSVQHDRMIAVLHFDTFTFAELNITIKYKCIFEKKSCSELTLTLVLNDYRLNQTATLLIGEPSQLEL